MPYKKEVFIILSYTLLVLKSFCINATGDSIPIADIKYSIVKTIPHDTTLFTEGLAFYNGKLFVSTGSPPGLAYTKCLIAAIDLTTGKVENKVELDRMKFFGEGITFLNRKLFQLTYKNQSGFIYDANSFAQLGVFHFRSKEGWGLTTNGKDLIMSDGTDTLTFLYGTDQKQVKILKVTENGSPVVKLNELEYINGFIYANVWKTSYIIKIDPKNGKVVAKLDLAVLVNEIKLKKPNAGSLNGIAFDPGTNKIYITGKMWPIIYQIDFPH